MTEHECTIETLTWVWGTIVKCECGKRYDSPDEADELLGQCECGNCHEHE